MDNHARIQREGGGPTWKITAIWFLINSGLDPMENHKDTKTASNVGPPLALKRNEIYMAIRWWVDDGPFLVVFGSALPSSTKKNSI